MRIALFTETFLPKIDGIVTRLKHTVEHLQRLGHQVLVFSPDGGLKEYKGAKAPVIPFKNENKATIFYISLSLSF